MSYWKARPTIWSPQRIVRIRTGVCTTIPAVLVEDFYRASIASAHAQDRTVEETEHAAAVDGLRVGVGEANVDEVLGGVEAGGVGVGEGDGKGGLLGAGQRGYVLDIVEGHC